MEKAKIFQEMDNALQIIAQEVSAAISKAENSERAMMESLKELEAMKCDISA